MTKKDKTIRIVVNSVLLAAIAVLGISVYRTGSEGRQQKLEAQQELAMLDEQEQDLIPEEEEPTVDAGTAKVEAEMTGDAEAEPSEETAALPEETSESGAADAVETGESVESETAESPDSEESAEEPVSAIPAVNFTEETPMVWPLAGDILLDYSMDKTIYHPTLDVYKYNPAIVISAAPDSPVMAASNGTVSSIAEDEETGTTVTLDMGNGYQAVYGQLANVLVGEGQTVGESTILGYVAPPTKYYSVEGSNLYFAMRKDGVPVDPITYLP